MVFKFIDEATLATIEGARAVARRVEHDECGQRDCPAFRSGESQSPPPPRDPSSDGRPAMGCSLPRLTRCRRRTAAERPCGRAPRTAVPEGRGFHVGSRGPNRSDRTPPGSVPAQDRSAGGEQGLTARPSPSLRTPVPLKGLSTRRRENRGTPSGWFDATRPREVGFRSVRSAYSTPRAYHAPPTNVTNAAATTDQRW